MEVIAIHSTKYDGSLHWRYEALLLEEGPWGWLTFHPRDRLVRSHKGDWLHPYPFLRWHWRDRWWDAVLVFDRGGHWLEWYCNIITPPTREADTLRFHDLDLDVVWHRERGLFLADEDEFVQHAARMAYPPALVAQARQSAQELVALIEQGAWRFGEEPSTLTLPQELAPWTVPSTY